MSNQINILDNEINRHQVNKQIQPQHFDMKHCMSLGINSDKFSEIRLGQTFHGAKINTNNITYLSDWPDANISVCGASFQKYEIWNATDWTTATFHVQNGSHRNCWHVPWVGLCFQHCWRVLWWFLSWFYILHISHAGLEHVSDQLIKLFLFFGSVHCLSSFNVVYACRASKKMIGWGGRSRTVIFRFLDLVCAWFLVQNQACLNYEFQHAIGTIWLFFLGGGM